MKPATLTVFELFEKERRYVIPLFQRPYVWTKEKQWTPLWDDIASKADQLLYSGKNNSSISIHFLGAAVLAEIKTFGKQVAAREIIDGQQRLTTLQIILIAFRDIIRAMGEDEKTLNSFNRLTMNDCRMEQKIEQYKVWPTTADRQVFESVVNVGAPQQLMEIYPLVRIPRTKRFQDRPKLVDAYLFFHERITEYLNQPEEGDITPQDKLDALIDATTKFMQIVVIELEDTDDPQVIFETLNARGEPLLPSDLIRNLVFLEATRKGEDINYLYQKYWQHFDEYDANFWKKDERQGRMFRPRIDLFMFHFLVYQTGRDFLIPHLFQEFRNWWNQLPSSSSVEQRLQALYEYSQIYKNFFHPSGKPSRLDLFIERLKVLDTGTVYPILLLLFSRELNIDAHERDGIIADIESYLIRRLVCRLSNKNYNRVFLTFLRKLRAEEPTRTSSRQFLLEMKGDAVRWPDDAEFGRAWMMNPIYDWSPYRTLKILEALDLQLETGKQEILHIESRLTVEHIYPQTPTVGAWFPLDNEDLKHTFGNLTLLTQALNSSVSNGPFSSKRPEIAGQSRLRMNAYFQNYKNEDVWSATDIVKRGVILYNMARDIWSHPLSNDNQHELVVDKIVAQISQADEYNDDPIADEEPFSSDVG